MFVSRDVLLAVARTVNVWYVCACCGLGFRNYNEPAFGTRQDAVGEVVMSEPAEGREFCSCDGAEEQRLRFAAAVSDAGLFVTDRAPTNRAKGTNMWRQLCRPPRLSRSDAAATSAHHERALYSCT
ncbi:hypothetical protein MRX96_047814 [Rhipicephalus microplus]